MTKCYGTGVGYDAVREVSLELQAGEFISIVALLMRGMEVEPKTRIRLGWELGRFTASR